jgi:hypothetical protein
MASTSSFKKSLIEIYHIHNFLSKNKGIFLNNIFISKGYVMKNAIKLTEFLLLILFISTTAFTNVDAKAEDEKTRKWEDKKSTTSQPLSLSTSKLPDSTTKAITIKETLECPEETKIKGINKSEIKVN